MFLYLIFLISKYDMNKISKNLAILAVTYFILYQLFQFQSKLAFNASSAYEAERQNSGIKKLNFLENFAANIVIKLSESEKGGNFLLKLVRPTSSIDDKEAMRVNNRNYLNTVFNIKRENIKQSASSSADSDATLETKAAYCGADVVVDYSISKAGNSVEERLADTLHLGGGSLLALENIIIGMREGETLDAHIPYWYAGRLQQFMSSNEEKSIGLQLKVKLLKVMTREIRDVRIFDDFVCINQPLMCGNNVKLNVKISKANGQSIFQGPVNYTIGDQNYPLIFSYALFNKPLSSIRTVIAPSSLLKSSGEKIAIKLSQEALKSEELILLEFQPSA